MTAVISPDASLEDVVHSLRGSIVAARPAYPDVLHVEVRDSRGDLWRLATQDAEWSPSDPAELLNRSVESAYLDADSGELCLQLSGDSSFRVVPAAQEADDDPPNWKLYTPNGLVMVFGPGGHWQFNRADEPSSLPLNRRSLEKSPPVSVEGDLIAVLNREEALSRQLLDELPFVRRYQTAMTLAVGASITSLVAAAISLALSLK
jgi:hypothetical protein